MAWERRKGKKLYYTRSIREGNRIIRQYLGAGEAAKLAAQQDKERRRKERQARLRERIELARLREIGDQMEDYCRRVSVILESTLAQAGYQRHSRGAWRKTRQSSSIGKEETNMAEKNALAVKEAPQINGSDKEIILRADKGDETAREGMREIIARHGPQGMRPLVDVARDDLLKKLSGHNIALQEDVRFQMESLRAQLLEPGAGSLEQLLADRIMLCWLHLHYFEVLWSQTLGEVSQKQSANYEQSLESAHRRYLSAIRSLAQVRRLRLPSLQLNLANQQINLADRQINLSSDLPT